MSHKRLQELIRHLQDFYRCPSCETNYHFEDIKFLGEIETFCFVQLTCHECSLPVLATLSLGGKAPAKRKSDMKASEEAKFASRGAISASEIAEFHRFISKRRGGFSKVKHN